MSPVLVVSAVVAIVVLVPVIAVVIRGASVKRTVTCPANEWTPIVSNFSTGFARTIAVELAPSDGDSDDHTGTEAAEAEVTDDGTLKDERSEDDPGSDGLERIPGRWREVRPRRILSNESVAGDLATEMTFQRRWLDWWYRIEIHPDEDITAVVS